MAVPACRSPGTSRLNSTRQLRSHAVRLPLRLEYGRRAPCAGTYGTCWTKSLSIFWQWNWSDCPTRMGASTFCAMLCAPPGLFRNNPCTLRVLMGSISTPPPKQSACEVAQNRLASFMVWLESRRPLALARPSHAVSEAAQPCSLSITQKSNPACAHISTKAGEGMPLKTPRRRFPLRNLSGRRVSSGRLWSSIFNSKYGK